VRGAFVVNALASGSDVTGEPRSSAAGEPGAWQPVTASQFLAKVAIWDREAAWSDSGYAISSQMVIVSDFRARLGLPHGCAVRIWNF